MVYIGSNSRIAGASYQSAPQTRAGTEALTARAAPARNDMHHPGALPSSLRRLRGRLGLRARSIARGRSLRVRREIWTCREKQRISEQMWSESMSQRVDERDDGCLWTSSPRRLAMLPLPSQSEASEFQLHLQPQNIGNFNALKMADPLYELLTPYFDSLHTPSRPLSTDPTVTSYLSRLTTLSLSDLTSTEPASLAHSSQSLLRSLQALSKRSHISIVNATSQISELASSLPQLYSNASSLQNAIPTLESSTSSFATKYKRTSSEDEEPAEILTRRKKALLLSQNADRISSILDLPTLLSSSISSSAQSTHEPGKAAATSATSAAANYASALDLHAHIKRLKTLYPESPLISGISHQAELEMRHLTTQLIMSLQGPGVKLASAMRTIGWLRRVAPELDETFAQQQQKSSMFSPLGAKRPSLGAAGFGSTDGALGALFLVCRLRNLVNMLDALEPLRELADQETSSRKSEKSGKGPLQSSGQGQQTERYLKRYIEIFREQSFAIVSTYRSIFPSALPVPDAATPDHPTGFSTTTKGNDDTEDDGLLPIPSPLATFTPHLVDLLFETLKAYLPNVRDKAARDSLMTQVLYCAGSLGRLGGDFSMMLAMLEEELQESEIEDGSVHEDKEAVWVEVMKKHRIQASRLELLASGVGAGRTVSAAARETSAVS